MSELADYTLDIDFRRGLPSVTFLGMPDRLSMAIAEHLRLLADDYTSRGFPCVSPASKWRITIAAPKRTREFLATFGVDTQAVLVARQIPFHWLIAPVTHRLEV